MIDMTQGNIVEEREKNEFTYSIDQSQASENRTTHYFGDLLPNKAPSRMKMVINSLAFRFIALPPSVLKILRSRV